MEVSFARSDVHDVEVRALLERHVAYSRRVTPAGKGHALAVDSLDDADITIFAGRDGARVVAVGALRRIDAAHAELKSMHVTDERRGGGVGRQLVELLLAEARRTGYRRVSLETGSWEDFAPARILYERTGFVVCGPFGDYEPDPLSTFMTIELRAVAPSEDRQ